MKEIVHQAFIDTRQNFSTDRVVADPSLNESFIRRCGELGSLASAGELNFCLLNLRKAGLLKGLSIKRTVLADDESYRHASEIAARFLEKRDETTLDRIICDPSRVAEFDLIAEGIAPGFTPLQYRWAALKLRKTRVLRPELLSRVVRPTNITLGTIEDVTDCEMPEQQGLYIFYSTSQTLYVGEASNLRRRVAKHLDHSDNKNLARWFWTHGFQNVRLELQVLGKETTSVVRRALEAEMICTRRPVFNVQRLIVD